MSNQETLDNVPAAVPDLGAAFAATARRSTKAKVFMMSSKDVPLVFGVTS